MIPKPHITRRSSGWLCTAGDHHGWGETPQLAYYRWLSSWLKRYDF